MRHGPQNGCARDAQDGGPEVLVADGTPRAGTRTYLEVETKQNRPRMDLLEKLEEFAPQEASEGERALGITKLRYMSLRDRYSTSHDFGYRIDGIRLSEDRHKMPGPCPVPEHLRTIRTEAQLDEGLCSFFDAVGNGSALRARFVERLDALRTALETSTWFHHHECVASSLLLVYDGQRPELALETVDVRWIDFTKVKAVTRPITHHDEWQPGRDSHEDGFLVGLENLIAKLKGPRGTSPGRRRGPSGSTGTSTSSNGEPGGPVTELKKYTA